MFPPVSSQRMTAGSYPVAGPPETGHDEANVACRRSRGPSRVRDLPADQRLAPFELEFLRRRRRTGAARILGFLPYGQRCGLAVNDENTIGLNVGRELFRRWFICF